MTTELVPFEAINSLADAFVKSKMFPGVEQHAQAIVKIVAGRELGFGPVYSMMQLNVIQGKVTLGASAIGALVKRGGRYNYVVTNHDDKTCTVTFYDKSQKVYVSMFTLEDARKADLVKPGSSWAKYPRAMLFSRALTQGARIVCPENLSGVYAHEEMGAEVDEEGQVLALPEDKPQTAPPRAERAQTASETPKAIEDTPPSRVGALMGKRDEFAQAYADAFGWDLLKRMTTAERDDIAQGMRAWLADTFKRNDPDTPNELAFDSLSPEEQSTAVGMLRAQARGAQQKKERETVEESQGKF